MIIRSKAPLRLGLAGGGTDLDTYADKYTGFVLNATISLYVYVTIEVTQDDRIVFEAVAPLCAIASTPIAPPLTIQIPFADNF